VGLPPSPCLPDASGGRAAQALDRAPTPHGFMHVLYRAIGLESQDALKGIN